MNLTFEKFSKCRGITYGLKPCVGFPTGGSIVKQPPFVYRVIRWLCRQISSSWFREHGIVHEECIPKQGGVLFAAWHPASLIDPLLMLSLLPGQMTFVAKHTLFKTPILGQLMRGAGAKPIYRTQDTSNSNDSKKAATGGNTGLIDTLSDVLCEGGWCAIYPEGISHLMSQPQKTKTGPARIMLKALVKARESGEEPPSLVPVGLHYSDASKFRERALVSVHQPMSMPPLPGEEGAPTPSEEMITEFGADIAAERAWVHAVTESLGTELQRSSQGLDTWEDRKLLWRTRGLLSVHRNRMLGRKTGATYAEAVMGARRTRAAWLWLSENKPEQAVNLKSRVSNHAQKMDKYQLKEHELYDRDKRPGTIDLISAVFQIIGSWIFMAGLITWGALIGSWPPYRLSAPIATRMSLKENHTLGTHKIVVGFALLPIWWILVSFPVAFLLAAPASPLWDLNLYGLLPLIQPYVTKINWILLAFILMPLWSVAARLHLLLWSRSVRSIGTLKQWKRLRRGEIPWDELTQEQKSLAEILNEIGQGLVLPSDEDWIEPPTGKEDYESVYVRT
jgi:1-acyl-sn-glycerol-3-phosphate acyltransferase